MSICTVVIFLTVNIKHRFVINMPVCVCVCVCVDYQPTKSNIPIFSNALTDVIKPKAKCQFYMGYRKKA